jgi:ABC-type nitrate/sulfonate/bicarbonate transport system ATPase subunit/ABC-type nitrate/sulfonate/bicarbonate transport system permease component
MIGNKENPRANRLHVLLYSAIGALALLAAWMIVWRFAGSMIIPTPWDTIRETVVLLSLPHTWEQILTTLMRVVLGFLLALASGSVVGILSGRVKALELALRPVTLFLQGIPPLLWVIPLILLFGIGHLSPIMVIALICFPLVAVNMAEGVKTVPKHLEEMVDIFAPGVFPRFKEVVLPHLRPFFSATLDLGFALGLKASVVGEFFGANNGIGFQIQATYQSLQLKKLFSWGLILVLLIILSSHAVTRLAQFVRSLRKTPGDDSHVSGRALPGGRLPVVRPPAVRPPVPWSAAAAKDLHIKHPEVQGRASANLEVRNLSYGYPGSGPLLEGINLSVGPDEVAVVSGDSGIGKTTLLKLIAGILPPAHGEVKGPERVGFVFQDDRLLPWQTVLNNTALPLRHPGRRQGQAPGYGSRGHRRKNVSAFAAALLEDFGLGAEGEKYPEELSGGMRKRAAFARCFARAPGLILLDEPFSGLHREARKHLWGRFLHLLTSQRVPVVIVTHYPEELAGGSALTHYTLEGKPARIVSRSGGPRRKRRPRR